MSLEKALKYFEKGQYNKAEKIAKKFPNIAVALHMRGVIRMMEGQMDRALEYYYAARKARPDFLDANFGILELTDDKDTAEYLIKRVEKGEFKSLKGAVCTIFELGNWCDRIGDYENAWKWFKQGNELKQMILPTWEAEPLERYLEKSKEVINSAALKDLRDKKISSGTTLGEEYLFVLGIPRSGTTLIDKILSTHPEIKSGGEVIEFHPTVSRYFNDPLDIRAMFDAAPSEVGEATKEYQKKLHKKCKKDKTVKYYTDKTPTIWTLINYVQLLLPESKIVFMHRNPLDTAVSCYSRGWFENHGWAVTPNQMAQFFKLYKDTTKYINSYLSLDDDHYSYESFVEYPENYTRDLSAWLELDYDPKMNTDYTKGGQVRTSSLHQVRKPVYNSSVGRWKNYEPYLEEFIEEFEKKGVI